MKIAFVQSANFSGKIIDAHGHIGNWHDAAIGERYAMPKTYTVDDIDIFLKKPLPNGDIVEKMIVSTLDCIEPYRQYDEISGNIRLLEAAKQNHKIVPMAVCQPHRGSVDNIEKLFRDNPNKFCGLKFHPSSHDIWVSAPQFEPYMKFAQEHKLPALFHSEVNVKWNGIADTVGEVVKDKAAWSKSDPRLIYELAKKYPDVPVVLGHTGAGGAPAHKVAIDVLLESLDKKDAKLYCDISWMDFTPTGAPPEKPDNIMRLIEECKKRNALDRILFGTDAPLGGFGGKKDADELRNYYSTTVDRVKNEIRKRFSDAEEIIDKIYYKNAEELYLKNTKPALPLNDIVDTAIPQKSKYGTIIGVGIAVLAFAGYCLYKNTHKTDNDKNT